MISAQTTRAFLFAKATITSIGGLLASMRASQEPGGTPLRLAQRTTALAAKDEQASERALTHARGSAKAFLAAGRSLNWREADPGREVAARAEDLGGRRKGLDRSGDQRADPEYGHEPAGDVIGLGPDCDLAVERGDLILQVPEHLDEAPQAGACNLRNAGRRILDLCDQSLDVRRSLRRSDRTRRGARGER